MTVKIAAGTQDLKLEPACSCCSSAVASVTHTFAITTVQINWEAAADTKHNCSPRQCRCSACRRCQSLQPTIDCLYLGSKVSRSVRQGRHTNIIFAEVDYNIVIGFIRIAFEVIGRSLLDCSLFHQASMEDYTNKPQHHQGPDIYCFQHLAPALNCTSTAAAMASGIHYYNSSCIFDLLDYLFGCKFIYLL